MFIRLTHRQCDVESLVTGPLVIVLTLPHTSHLTHTVHLYMVCDDMFASVVLLTGGGTWHVYSIPLLLQGIIAPLRFLRAAEQYLCFIRLG